MKNNILDNLDKIIFQLKKDFNISRFILEETEKDGKESTYTSLRRKIIMYRGFLSFLAEEYDNWRENYDKNNIEDFINALFSKYKKDEKNGKSFIKLKSKDKEKLQNIFQLYIKKSSKEK